MTEWWKSLTGWQQVAVIWAVAAVVIVSFFFPMCTLEVSSEPARVERAEPPDRHENLLALSAREFAADVERTPRPEKKSAPIREVIDFTYWLLVGACETGGGLIEAIQWDYNGPSGFDGGLQFLPSTWLAFGGAEFAPFAWGASPEEQMIVAERTRAGSASDPWPNCP